MRKPFNFSSCIVLFYCSSHYSDSSWFTTLLSFIILELEFFILVPAPNNRVLWEFIFDGGPLKVNKKSDLRNSILRCYLRISVLDCQGKMIWGGDEKPVEKIA